MSYDLRALYDAANRAVDGPLALPRGAIDGAINWGCLSCTLAARCEDHRGEISYRIIIEECDPGASELALFISDKLGEAGFADVEVSWNGNGVLPPWPQTRAFDAGRPYGRS